MVMRSNISQNPSNAGDDDNLWPDWNAARGVGKDSRGDAEEYTFEKIRENSLEGAKERESAKQEAREAAQKPAFAHNANSYQGAGVKTTSNED